MRAVLDSDVWLAILTTDRFCRRMWRTARRTCQFAVSQDILSEVERKLLGKFGFLPRHARLLTLFVARQAELTHVVSTMDVCRDPDDNRVLAAAFDAGCSHVVTGDSDLLVLKRVRTVSVVTPREFLALIPAD